VTFPGFNILAEGDPVMEHVNDARLFLIDGLSEDSGLSRIGQALFDLGITKHVALFFVAGILTILFFWSYVRQIKNAPGAVPGRWGNLVESVLDMLKNSLVVPIMGESGLKFLPVLATFFVYILICNLIGLVPLLDLLGHGGNTATANIQITAGLALCAFVLYHGLGIKEQGSIVTYIKNLFPHVPLAILPLIIVIELLAHIIRPCALAVRLCANMAAGHVIIAVLVLFTINFTDEFFVGGGVVAVISVVGVTALTFLELLVALVQAFVFTFLTTVFLSMAVHPEH